VLFFICTNYVETMDAAVRRPGRIDHRIGIGPPDRDARLRILKENPVPADVRYARVAINALAEDAVNFSRKELGRARKELLVKPGWRSPRAARLASGDLTARMGRSITITKAMADEYERHKQDFGDVPQKEGKK
jgi:SpoVK/Ycf46/Vps4 family AAA+-type ATPase